MDLWVQERTNRHFSMAALETGLSYGISHWQAGQNYVIKIAFKENVTLFSTHG